MKKSDVILFSLVFLIIISSISIYAQETLTDSSEESESNSEENSQNEVLASAEEEFSNAELEQTAGFTPDSNLYFIEDKILTRFRNPVENKEKKVAEIREMIQEGNIDAAKKSLERYNEYANELKQEIDPESSQDAKKSAVAITRTLKEIESQIPLEQRDEFVGGVVSQEASIVTAAEIANKIQELCKELSRLDPSTYASTCKTGEDSPKWQQRMDRDLTEEQEKEARQFFEIMSSCFENPKECQCNQIKTEAFKDECNIIAPLAAKCDIDGDEEACNEMDARGDPIELLPDYLQDVMKDIEDKYSKSEFDNHAPQECRKEGVTNREDCMRIMFKLNAPEECSEALERGEIDLSNEREAREQCEEIMFNANAPPECVEAGLRDHKECGKFMFKDSAPPECIEAGLDGSSPKDPKKCREIMESLRGEENQGDGKGRGPRINFNCGGIQNAEERLECYDKAANGAQEHFENRGPQGGQEREGDFNNRDFQNGQFDNRGPNRGPNGEFREGSPCSTPEECKEFRQQNPNFNPPQGDFREGEFREGEFNRQPGEFRDESQFRQGEETFNSPPPSSTSSSSSESESSISSSEGSSSPSSSESSSSESSSESTASSTSITGNIIGNNRFMRYYFRF